MTTESMPPLPEPEGVIVVGTQALRAFTADQMHAYAQSYAAQLQGPAMSEDWPECEEFYNAMQRYRHHDVTDQQGTADAYEGVKALIRRYAAQEVAKERDCRTCVSFSGFTCSAALRCIDGSSYRALVPIQAWERSVPNPGF